jgi:hypothetical protein
MGKRDSDTGVVDFGAKTRPTWRRGQRLAFVAWVGARVGLVSGFLVFASLPTMMALNDFGPPVADPRTVKIQGKPCRITSAALFDRGWRAPARVIHFEGVAFARRRGDIFCHVRHEGFRGTPYPVCEFDTPYSLAVTKAGAPTAYFEAPPGYTVVVQVKAAGTSCLVTKKFDLLDLVNK